MRRTTHIAEAPGLRTETRLTKVRAGHRCLAKGHPPHLFDAARLLEHARGESQRNENRRVTLAPKDSVKFSRNSDLHNITIHLVPPLSMTISKLFGMHKPSALFGAPSSVCFFGCKSHALTLPPEHQKQLTSSHSVSP